MTLILNVIACHRHINKDIKGTDDYHLLGWVLDFFFLSSALFLTFGRHMWLDTVFIPGVVFGLTKLLTLNTYRELFGVPDIALYASAPNHVFGL